MRWTVRLLRAIFPRRCIYCDRVINADAASCKDCADRIPRMTEPVCYRCGRSREYCTCKQRVRAFDRVVSAMQYTSGVKVAVLRLKKHDDADLVETMAEEMVAVLRVRVDAAAFDAVACIPMWGKRQRGRGFNQSELLAREVAKLIGVPFRPLLKKLYDTAEQKDLPLIERSGNLLGAFDVCGDVKDLRVLLVDDLITTGSTLHEAAKMLSLYGASSVTALTFAATIPKEEEDETIVSSKGKTL